MTLRTLTVPILALAALAACQTSEPSSTAGVGFASYAGYQSEREAQMIAQGEGMGTFVQPGAISPEPVRTATLGRAQATPGAVNNSVGISSENNFDAVSAQRSIEEDKALVAANREAYVFIEPRELNARPSSTEANIVQFALSTTNTVGQPLYSRLIIGAGTRARMGCSKFPSPDKAQEAFLNAGGPERDPRGLDPDGDGFACSWDPAPFRLAARSRVSQ